MCEENECHNGGECGNSCRMGEHSGPRLRALQCIRLCSSLVEEEDEQASEIKLDLCSVDNRVGKLFLWPDVRLKLTVQQEKECGWECDDRSMCR